MMLCGRNTKQEKEMIYCIPSYLQQIDESAFTYVCDDSSETEIIRNSTF